MVNSGLVTGRESLLRASYGLISQTPLKPPTDKRLDTVPARCRKYMSMPQSVVVCQNASRCGAAGDHLHHGRLNFHGSHDPGEKLAHGGNDFPSAPENNPRLSSLPSNLHSDGDSGLGNRSGLCAFPAAAQRIFVSSGKSSIDDVQRSPLPGARQIPRSPIMF